MAESVGDIVLDASIDGSALPAQLRRAAAVAAKGVKIEVPADLDEKGLAAEVEATAKALSKYAEIEFTADLNAKKMAAEVAALKKSLGKVSISNAPTELRSAWAKAAAAAKKATEAADIRIKASVDFDEAERKLAQLKATRLFAEKPIKIPVEIDDRGKLLVEIQKLKRQIRENEQILINVDFDESTLNAGKLRGIVKKNMQAQLDEIRKQHVEIIAQVKADLDPLQEQLRNLNKERRADIEAEVDLDASKAKIEFDALKAELEADDTVKMHIEAEPDLISARLAGDAIRAALDKSPIEIPVRADGSVINFDRRGFTARLKDKFRDVTDFFANLGEGIAESPLVKSGGLILRYTAATVGLVAAAIAVALPYLKAFGALLAYVALQLLAASGAAATFVAGGIVAIGAAAATAAIGVMGMSTAFTALSKIWAKNNAGLKASKEETEAYQAALKALHPEARKVVEAVNDMYPAFRQLQQQVQGTLFKGLGNQLRSTFSAVLPTLRTGFTGIAGVLNDLATNTLRWIRSSEGIKALNDIFRISERTLRQLGTAAGNVAIGLITLFVGSDKNIDSLGQSLIDLTDRFKNWAKQVTKDGSWEDWLADGRKVLGDLGGIIGGIKDIAVGFWQAMTGDDAATLPDVIEGIRKKFEEWGAWMRDPKNQEAIKKFITDAKDNLIELGTAATNTARFINDLSAAIQILEDKLNFIGGSGPDSAGGKFRKWIVDTFTGGPPPTLTDNPVSRWITGWFNSIDWSGIGQRIWTGFLILKSMIFKYFSDLFSKPPPIIIDWSAIWDALTGPDTSFGKWLREKFKLGEKINLWDIIKIIFMITSPWDEIWNQLTDPASSFRKWFADKFKGFKIKLPLPGGAGGGSWFFGNTPGIEVPVTPKLGKLPRIKKLKPIPWPILPKLGPTPKLPDFPPIQIDIPIKFLPLPQFPTLPKPRITIGLGWGRVPGLPFLPKPKVTIGLAYGPVPAPPKLPPLKRRIDLYYGDIPDAKGELIDPAAKGATFVNGAQMRIVGEAGPEAIVPLTRTQPLDPAVSALLRMVASSRGLDQPTAKGKDLPAANINVMLPTGDPEAAAMAVWNRLIFEGVV